MCNTHGSSEEKWAVAYHHSEQRHLHPLQVGCFNVVWWRSYQLNTIVWNVITLIVDPWGYSYTHLYTCNRTWPAILYSASIDIKAWNQVTGCLLRAVWFGHLATVFWRLISAESTLSSIRKVLTWKVNRNRLLRIWIRLLAHAVVIIGLAKQIMPMKLALLLNAPYIVGNKRTKILKNPGQVR